MNIINLTPNTGGGYPPIQSWSGATPPEGYAEVSCDTAAFYEYRGFVALTLTDGVVTEFVGNQEALDAYLAEYQDVLEADQEATDAEVLNVLLGVSE